MRVTKIKFSLCFCFFLVAAISLANVSPKDLKKSYIESKLTNADTYSLKTKKGEESFLIFNQNQEKLKNFIIEFDVVPHNSQSQFGIVTRYNSTTDWTYIGCDLTTDILGRSHWYGYNSKNEKKNIAIDIAKFYKDYSRHVFIKVEDKTVSIYIDGEKITHTTLSLLGDKNGYLGFRAFDGAEITISNIKTTKIKPQEELENSPLSNKLSSDKLELTFSKNYPSVYQYYLKGSKQIVAGAKQITKSVILNGKSYIPQVNSLKTANKVIYHLDFPELKLSFDTEFYLDEAILTMKLNNIREQGIFRLQTIAFPNHDMVSMDNQSQSAKMSIAHAVSYDQFINLADRGCDTINLYAAIVILNNDKYAVTIDNNSIYNAEQIAYRTYKHKNRSYTSLFSNEWIYRDVLGRELPIPEMKIMFSEDSNTDRKIDWQDAAYDLARIYPESYGADMLRNSYATITMNFASGGQYPFLRQLDNIKKFNLATDGFGQMLELKGYQSEGHDSGHPDFSGNYNKRAGGLKEFQILTEKAKEYNANIGIHINHSESYPEAKAYDNEIVTDIPGWQWLDQSYLINKERDIKRGTFMQRLDQLKLDAPHLSFIYIDTYREHRSIAYLTEQEFIKNNWAIWTEEPDVFFRQGSWMHYNPESKSIISRFVHHQFRDGHASHPFLLGGYSRGAAIGFMGWQKGRDFNLVLKNFFTQQLPYRYLMHSALKQITDEKAIFENDIESSAINGVNQIRQNNRLIRSGELVFIPWNPTTKEKIYHYNSQGGRSVWTLPIEWKDKKTVKLYKLTTTGKEWVKDIAINPDQEISIDANPAQGYVIYPNEPTSEKEVKWGEYSLINNPGFDGKLTGWQTQEDETAGIITTDYGQDILKLASAASVKQSIKLEHGQQYSLSVWVKVLGKGKASLAIDGESYSIGESTVTNFTDNTDRYKTKFQRIKIPFVYSGKSDEIKLSFEPVEANSYALFDDVRIVEQASPKFHTHSYFEDFEDVDEGLGPFVASQQGAYTTHLSEKHEGYTDDTIDGIYSLKTWREKNGEVYRTSPAMIRFKTNNSYKFSFSYKATGDGIYKVVVKSVKGKKELLSESLNGKSNFQAEFSTDNHDDYYICIFKEGDATLILDNFAIDGDLDR